jgi:hypothetical protein
VCGCVGNLVLFVLVSTILSEDPSRGDDKSKSASGGGCCCSSSSPGARSGSAPPSKLITYDDQTSGPQGQGSEGAAETAIPPGFLPVLVQPPPAAHLQPLARHPAPLYDTLSKGSSKWGPKSQHGGEVQTWRRSPNF